MAEAEKAGGESLEELINRAQNSKEPLKKPPTEPIRPQSLLERIVLSKWTALLSAAAMGTFEYLIPKSPPPDQPDNLITSGLMAGLGYITASLMRQDWLIRKAQSVKRKIRPFPLKLLSLLPEPRAWQGNNKSLIAKLY